MSTLTLIADRSTMSGGDVLGALLVIALILGVLYGAAALGERRAAARDRSEARRCDECSELNDLVSGPTCSGCTQRGEYLDAQIRGAR